MSLEDTKEVLLLIAIGFLAGVITAVSPCVLPVLPVILAGGATGRRPLRIVLGLVVSFSFFTLFASWLLARLGLPQDLLRNAAIVLLVLVAAALLVPRAGALIERPFQRFSRLHPRGGGGFLYGTTLGLIFVPCAGPVLAAITVVAAQNHVGWRAIVLTVSYGLGAGVVLLLIALGGRRAQGRLRASSERLRLLSGALIALVVVGLLFHVDDRLSQLTPGYTSYLQSHVEGSKSALKQLAKVSGVKPLSAKATTKGPLAGLPDYGRAPAIAGGDWFNSPPLTISSLKGKVVLIDFWTYSCINCLRTLPHLEAWYARYQRQGLEIIGVHTPEFAFEHVAANVKAAVKRLGIRYPVVQDNGYQTWDNYANQYWPAEYLIDRQGQIREAKFGEGDYGKSEALIRRLLGASGPLAKATADTTPTGTLTAETYLGYARLQHYVGPVRIKNDQQALYTFPAALSSGDLAYSGGWTVGPQQILAGAGAKLRLSFQASKVYIVLGGRGTVQVLVNGKPSTTLKVDSYRLYTALSRTVDQADLLELDFSPGVNAYSFTFG